MITYFKKHPLPTAVGFILLLALLYYSSGYFLIYNNNAFVTADWYSVKSKVPDTIAAIPVKDNQFVKKGTLLVAFDHPANNIKSPSDGYVNHLVVHEGEYVDQDQLLFGFIVDQSWRVVANMKESNLVGISPGKSVWIYLSTHPWHLYHGVIESVGKGVARSASASTQGLPYIEPVSSWIRYDYRIPVTIRFNPMPARDRLYVGTDVTVLLF